MIIIKNREVFKTTKVINALIGKEVRIVLKNNRRVFGTIEYLDKELYINVKGNIMGINVSEIESLEEIFDGKFLFRYFPYKIRDYSIILYQKTLFFVPILQVRNKFEP